MWSNILLITPVKVCALHICYILKLGYHFCQQWQNRFLKNIWHVYTETMKTMTHRASRIWVVFPTSSALTRRWPCRQVCGPGTWRTRRWLSCSAGKIPKSSSQTWERLAMGALELSTLWVIKICCCIIFVFPVLVPHSPLGDSGDNDNGM